MFDEKVREDREELLEEEHQLSIAALFQPINGQLRIGEYELKN